MLESGIVDSAALILECLTSPSRAPRERDMPSYEKEAERKKMCAPF